ncbi:hypothetical protein V8E36_009707 [Tilletia maclaganii]
MPNPQASASNAATPTPTHGILITTRPAANKNEEPAHTAATAAPQADAQPSPERIFIAASPPTVASPLPATPSASTALHEKSGKESSSKFSTLINKLGRRTGSSSHQQHSIDSPGAAAESAATTGIARPASVAHRKSNDDYHAHKKAKHTSSKSRNGSGKHTPVVEGDYGQFLAAAELRAALEREQAKAAKRSEKDKSASTGGGGAGKHTGPSKTSGGAHGAPAAAAVAQTHPPVTEAEYIKPSHSLPGAFVPLSRASSRSHRKGSGTSTPKDRSKRAGGYSTPSRSNELRPPNPCGMPIYDSEDENEDDEEEEEDAATPLAADDKRPQAQQRQVSASSALASVVASATAKHILHAEEEDEDGRSPKSKKHLQRSGSSSGGGGAGSAEKSSKRRSFFGLSRGSDSHPKQGSRHNSFGEHARADGALGQLRLSDEEESDSGDDSDESIMRASYALDLAAINTQEMLSTEQNAANGKRPGSSSGGTTAVSSFAKAGSAGKEEDEDDVDISSTRSLKSWRSHPSGSSISETMSESTVVLSKPLIELEEFELDNFIKNFSRHTKEVRVPFAPAATRRMPQWSDFKVPANEAEEAAREGRKVTVLTHVDRGLQAILQDSSGVPAVTGPSSGAGAGAGATGGSASDAAGSGTGPVGADGPTAVSLERTASGHDLKLGKKKGQDAKTAAAAAGAEPSKVSISAGAGGRGHAPAQAQGQLGPGHDGHVSDAPHIKWAPQTDGATSSYKKRLGFGHGHGHGSSSGSLQQQSSSGHSQGGAASGLSEGEGPGGGAREQRQSERLDDAMSLDDRWEVVEGVALKHEDGRVVLNRLGSSDGFSGAGAGGGDEGSGAADGKSKGRAGGWKDDDEQVDAVAFVIAYILALVERYAPEELDNGPDDRYREGKLRSHLERLYIIAPFWERFLLGVRKLYRWEKPTRTGAAAMIYFVLWYADLLPTAFMLSLLYYILQFRFFPPSESFLHEQVRKRMKRGVEADKFSEQLRRRSRLDLLELYRQWIDRFGIATQTAAGDIADFHEKVKNLILWRNPTATWRTFTLLSIATVAVTFASAHLIWKASFFFLGITFFVLLPLQSHYPRYRRPLSPIWWVLWGSPTDFVWGSKILRERHAKLHGQQWPALAERRSGGKSGTKSNLYAGLLHLRGIGRHTSSAAAAGGGADAMSPRDTLDEVAAAAARANKYGDELRLEGSLEDQAKEAQRGHKLASFFCQHHTVPGHLHVTTRMIYFVALHSTRPSNSRKTCKTELSEIAGLAKTNNFRLLGFHGLKVRKRDGKSMHFSNMSHRDDAFNLILSVTGSVWSKV